MKYRKLLIFAVVIVLCAIFRTMYAAFAIFLLSMHMVHANYARILFYKPIRRAMYWLLVEPILYGRTFDASPLITYPTLIRLKFGRKWLVDKYVELGATESYFIAVADYLTKPREKTSEELENDALMKECDDLEEELFGFGVPDKELDDLLKKAKIKRSK